MQSERPARERPPVSAGKSAALSRKGFQDRTLFVISLVRVEIINKEIDFESLPQANTLPRVFTDAHIFLI